MPPLRSVCKSPKQDHTSHHKTLARFTFLRIFFYQACPYLFLAIFLVQGVLFLIGVFEKSLGASKDYIFDDIRC